MLLNFTSLTLTLTLLFSIGLANAADDDYIIVFKTDNKKTLVNSRTDHHNWLKDHLDGGSHIRGNFTIGKDLLGYHGKFDKSVIDKIKARPEIASVEPDYTATIPVVRDNEAHASGGYEDDKVPWGLGRISHKELPDFEKEKVVEYKADPGQGETIAYVLDSGVLEDHNEFSGRAKIAKNFIDEPDEDTDGHGTHVAGIIAGNTVGVSNTTKIVSLKIFGESGGGPYSALLDALQWAVDDHNKNPDQKAVINYSGSGPKSDSLTKAVKAATDAGLIFVSAAGNSNEDACDAGPGNGAADNDKHLLIAGTNQKDTRYSGSCYGKCVTAYAPAEQVYSAFRDGKDKYGYMTGTSMASPYVAGLISYFYAKDSSYSMDKVIELAIEGNPDRVKENKPDTPNKLAYNHQDD